MTAKLIVEADGGSRGDPGVAGYGALVRDQASGAVLAERAAPLGKQSNNVAEYTGLVEGLRAVVENAIASDVLVRMDSKLVVEQMSGRWKIKHADMKRLAAQAREFASDISDAGGSVRYEWIPREKNKAADKLSNDGMDGLTVRRDIWSDLETREQDEADRREPPVTAADVGAESRETLLADVARPLRAGPDLSAPTRIVLVRHGVTDFTTSGKLDGRGGANPSLSAKGEDQAARVAEAALALAGEDAHVITSSLARAIETGATIAKALGVTPTEDADWDEQAFGVWDGLSFKEIRELDAEGLTALRNDPEYSAPGGESRTQLDARVANALDRAVMLGGTVFVVTHRIVIMSVLAKTLGLSTQAGWRLAAAPASLTGVEVWRDGNASIAFTNDTHHLR